MSRTRSGIDGLSSHLGFEWEAADRVRMTIRPDLINPAGLLSGAVAYALVDYCMGSTLWVERAEGEAIATIGISISYLQTATGSFSIFPESRLSEGVRGGGFNPPNPGKGAAP
jgi:acyl-coenzyme A thioesterase PaaI-like protein